MSISPGVISAGHELTVQAGDAILQDGGNAYDAALAALAAACVVEPVLASMAGGGFMLAKPADASSVIYDFFVQTPGRKRPEEEIDFHSILADFGDVQQEFHIGMASAAVPGQVLGMFEIHKDLCSMPMREIFAPAIEFARNGAEVNAFQAFLFTVIQSIFLTGEDLKATFGSQIEQDKMAMKDEVIKQPALADFFEVLAAEGPDLFYRGEIAQSIDRDMKEAGLLTSGDLGSYEVIRRKPLRTTYKDVQVEMNPPPSSGGLLIALGLKLLEDKNIEDLTPGTAPYLRQLVWTLDKTLEARVELEALAPEKREEAVLDKNFLAQYRNEVLGTAKAMQGTTHISAIDKDGNIASVTVSNGQGCHYMIPGTGVIMNNMMGEADLNPHGFHGWTPDTRMTSMMSPTILLWPDGRRIAIGSGGSNRIRTAMLQTILNLVAFEMPLSDAVEMPRMHLEPDRLYIEGGFTADLGELLETYPDHDCFDDLNLFFGGTHIAEFDGNRFHGTGDVRRNGACNL